jgi:hypothetical protein
MSKHQLNKLIIILSAIILAGLAFGSIAGALKGGSHPQPPIVPGNTTPATVSPAPATASDQPSGSSLTFNCAVYDTTGGTEVVWQAANNTDQNIVITAIRVLYSDGYEPALSLSQMENASPIADADSSFADSSTTADGNWFPDTPAGMDATSCSVVAWGGSFTSQASGG